MGFPVILFFYLFSFLYRGLGEGFFSFLFFVSYFPFNFLEGRFYLFGYPFGCVFYPFGCVFYPIGCVFYPIGCAFYPIGYFRPFLSIWMRFLSIWMRFLSNWMRFLSNWMRFLSNWIKRHFYWVRIDTTPTTKDTDRIAVFGRRKSLYRSELKEWQTRNSASSHSYTTLTNGP